MIIMVFIKLKSMNHICNTVIQHMSYLQILAYLLSSIIQIYSSSEQEERNHIHIVLFSPHGITLGYNLETQ
jgi:hypothetical protein